MQMFRRVMGYFFIATAVVVAVHTVIEPLYHVSTSEQPYSPVWGIINVLMIISIVLGVIFAYQRRLRSATLGNLREYIAANVMFYGFGIIAILFLFNYFGISELAKDYTAVGDDTRSLVWILVDAILPFLNGAMGVYLIRKAGVID